MTQFVLCKQNGVIDSGCRIMMVPAERDCFLSKAASSLFPDTQEESLFTIVFDDESFDSLCTAAQQDMAEDKPFTETKLFQCLEKLLESCSEIAFWYAHDYDDLDFVCDKESLLKKIEEALIDSRCELYARYLSSEEKAT